MLDPAAVDALVGPRTRAICAMHYGGWMGESRPDGGHALAILPGLTHYNLGDSPLFAAAALAFLDHQPN